MRFVRKKTYYTGVVYEFNLPTGWTCPFANECLVRVDKSADDVPKERPIDTNDDFARVKDVNFALVDNFAK